MIRADRQCALLTISSTCAVIEFLIKIFEHWSRDDVDVLCDDPIQRMKCTPGNDKNYFTLSEK